MLIIENCRKRRVPNNMLTNRNHCISATVKLRAQSNYKNFRGKKYQPQILALPKLSIRQEAMDIFCPGRSQFCLQNTCAQLGSPKRQKTARTYRRFNIKVGASIVAQQAKLQPAVLTSQMNISLSA